MRALLIEFDGVSGKRPAGIDPNDPKLQCHGWQQLDASKVIELGWTPKFAPPGSVCLEIRVIEDERDISQYEGRENEGLVVLHNDDEIQAAIDRYMTPAYQVADEVLFRIHLEQKGIRLDDVPGKDTQEVLKNLHAQGVKGIVEIKRPSLVDIYGPPGTRKARGLPE